MSGPVPNADDAPLRAAAPVPRGRCARHPGREAMFDCVDCGGSFCPECVFIWEGDPICRSCIGAYQAPERYSPPTAPGFGVRRPEPIFTFRMFRSILLSPGKFFESMPRDRGMAEPILFAFGWGVMLFLLSAPANYLTLLVLVSHSSALGSAAPKVMEAASEVVAKGFWSFLATMPAYAVMTLVVLMLVASIQHFLLMVMGRRSRFELTVRIAFFAIVAQALAIVPIPGVAMLAAEVYRVALWAVGLKKVYRLGTGSALFVAVVPAVVVQLLQAGLGGF